MESKSFCPRGELQQNRHFSSVWKCSLFKSSHLHFPVVNFFCFLEYIVRYFVIPKGTKKYKTTAVFYCLNGNHGDHVAERLSSPCDVSSVMTSFPRGCCCCLLRPQGGSESGAEMAAWQASRFSSSSAPTTPPSLKTSWRSWTWKLTMLYRYLQEPGNLLLREGCFSW